MHGTGWKPVLPTGGGVGAEEAFHFGDLLAGGGDVNFAELVLLPDFDHGVNALFVEFVEMLGRALGFGFGDAEEGEGFGGHLEGGAAGFAIDVGDAALDHFIGLGAVGGAGDDGEMGEVFFDGVDDFKGFGLIVDGEDEELGGVGSGGGEHVDA